jgi:thymidylate synthase (FAD)
MRVELIAQTRVEWTTTDQYLSNEYDATDADFLSEFGGRECYQSWSRPNPETADTHDYVQKNLIDKQHFSVLEHGSVTFRISDVSRSFTHEVVRHRHQSPSQLSQRYVPRNKMTLAIHPTLALEGMGEVLIAVWEGCIRAYDQIEAELLNRGYSVKAAREAAREVLPNATGTVIILTGNHRAWREFIEKRMSPHADKQIAFVAAEILEQLRAVAPAIYSDIPDVDLRERS